MVGQVVEEEEVEFCMWRVHFLTADPFCCLLLLLKEILLNLKKRKMETRY